MRLSNAQAQRHEVYRIFGKFLSGSPGRVIHIAGANNTGKTSLAREFVLSSLPLKPQNFFWVETENKLDPAPFRNIAPNSPGQVLFFPLRTTSEFKALLEKIRTGKTWVNSGDTVVVDSLSNLLKNGVASTENYGEWLSEVTHFFRDIKGRLAHLAISRGIHFLLVHHMSYNPTIDRTVPYFNDHMKEILGLWAYLRPMHPAEESEINHVSDFSLDLDYSVREPVIDAQGRPVYNMKRFRRSYRYSLVQGKIKLD